MKTKKQVQVFEGKKKLNSRELQNVWGGPSDPTGSNPGGGG